MKPCARFPPNPTSIKVNTGELTSQHHAYKKRNLLGDISDMAPEKHLSKEINGGNYAAFALDKVLTDQKDFDLN